MIFCILAGVRRLQKFAYKIFDSAYPRDVLFAPACPLEKVTIGGGRLCLTPGSQTNEGVPKYKASARVEN